MTGKIKQAVEGTPQNSKPKGSTSQRKDGSKKQIKSKGNHDPQHEHEGGKGAKHT